MIITRFPPSPTGNLHIGGARTALFNFLYARKHQGKFVLRIEDTDKERSKPEFETDIIEGLNWLGLADDARYKQSDRKDIYKGYLEKMLAKGSAYEAEDSVIRFKNPNKKIKFYDLIRGEIEFDTTDLGDFVIAKSLTEPLYHLAVVVDDHESAITHVIRGEDHISNTPRQILIQEAIGAERPFYAHIPLILASDRSKLSKRHGAVSLLEYRDKGYLPEAMVNYLALLGWNPGTEQEIFTLEELIKIFDIDKIQKGGAIFDQKKLEWVNKEHIKRLPEEERITLIAKSISEEPYIKSEPNLDLSKINWKSTPQEETKKHLQNILAILSDKDKVMAYAEEEGRGNVLWPLRFALTGAEKSPDPFTLIQILGAEESRQRVSKAIELL